MQKLKLLYFSCDIVVSSPTLAKADGRAVHGTDKLVG